MNKHLSPAPDSQPNCLTAAELTTAKVIQFQDNKKWYLANPTELSTEEKKKCTSMPV
jgi:hypothetical protein